MQSILFPPGGKGPYEDYFLEISDQNGKPLTLPDAERKVGFRIFKARLFETEHEQKFSSLAYCCAGFCV